MATYYVDMAVGDDGNLGTSEGAGNAWKTMDKAASTVAAGDKVWVKASADYTETVGLDTEGSYVSWIEWEGYTTTTGDGGRATVDGQSTRANCVNEATAMSNQYYRWKNFRFTGATDDGFNPISNYAIFHNCRFDNCGAHGVDAASYWIFVDCEFDNNALSGCDGSLYNKMVGCVAHSNTGSGISLATGSSAIYCIAYGNGSSATAEGQYYGGAGTLIANCTADGDNSATKLGHYAASQAWVSFNNIFYDCHVGLRASSSGRLGYQDYNSYVDNTTDQENISDGLGGGSMTGSGDPFTDSAGRDYTLASTSEGESDAARDYDDASSGVDMGAQQLAQAGGAGGGVIGGPNLSGGRQA